ncbi:MAG: hypothetical protein RR068_10110 [Hafnia sp.]
MRKLQKLINTEREEFTPYSRLSAESISRIAAQCGRDEVADAHILLKQLQAERVTVPDWDGDTVETSGGQSRYFARFLPTFNNNPSHR